MKRVTIKDIASHLCLSVSTVSRALADDKNILKETKEKIFAASRELGYARNVIAANLRTGRSHTIGVMVDQMISPYAAKVLKGINGVMREHGIYVVTCDADNDPSIEKDYLHMVRNSFLDGLIIAHCNNSDNSGLYKELSDRGLPMVFLRSSLDGLDAPVVCVNSYDKGFFLVDHLVCTGRRRIVNVKGPSLSGEMRDLDKAYVDVMNKFGLPVIGELQLSAGVDMLSGREVADRLIDGGVDFDAVFAINELVAIGVMNRLLERGVKVPDDVSVAAFTGSLLSEMVHPAMTSVEAPLEEMGRRAAELLINMIKHPGVRHPGIIIDARIRIRESSDITPRPAL
ncbi:MAG: LacI family transcriptional regulator [Muribaculaceae bacterium]|nr:LacI family transcriptional regulator [Muribaculaceae bacterium]